MARSKQVASPISIEELKVYYREMNRKAFNGALPNEIPLTFVARSGYSGKAFAIATHTKTARERARYRDPFYGALLNYSSLRIEISMTKARSVEEIKAILLHEMIHIMFYVLGDFSQEHGPKFMKKLHELRALTGLDIPLTEETELEDMSVHDTEIAVVLIKRAPGNSSIAMLAPKAAKEALREIEERLTAFNEENVLIYLTRSTLINQLSLLFKVQRKFGSKTRFSRMKARDTKTGAVQDYEGQIIAELEQHGTLIHRF